MATQLCPYFGKCGGCSSQHLDYNIQLENKKKALAHAVQFQDIKVFSGKEYYYRNRMDMIFHATGIGLRKRSEWYTLIDVEKCVIANERVNDLIQEVRDFFKEADYFDIKKKSGTFRYAVIRASDEDSSISIVLNSESKRITEAIEKVKEFALQTTANNVVATYVPSNSAESISDDFFVIKGKDMLTKKYIGRQFFYSVQGFFQNNDEMAEKMHEYCNELLKNYNTKDANLLDLYGGVGTFGINNAELFKGTTIIESLKQCIDAANINIKVNNIQNIKAILLDAIQLKKAQLSRPLFVITDPPRTGMHQKTIEQLKMLKPEVIIYISCNTEQLKKEVLKFKQYKVKSAALFDLFPQTNHSEAIVELVKREN